ncbi:hypothetical protein CVU82_03975 [Candidatus Falkowbacteria bacterium HGW-Falkowbacteria-1]|jgi:hypothetical protein|uniref:Uncharacterized protein n=1 Tax=Candidatus Falkowbacteria bacterium HGW-Falkowbacteria-1 TaxID=2013768 RepID=A0A2N2E8X8_9BACT|nr:MAG: hypothetical protein CVU82_03975 [Candidatus Falkowbacteria bacterium HGW-Falkowbacteria-1]
MKTTLNRRKFLLGVLTVFVSFFLFFPALKSSAQLVPGSSQPDQDQYKYGDYKLNDALEVGIRITKIILGLVGSLALLFFVYGGVMFLISAGNSEQVQKAKGIIINAAIGLIIVFMSYIIIQFAMKALGVNWNGSSSLISSTFEDSKGFRI